MNFVSWKLETTVTPATYSADSGPGAGGPTKIPAKLKALRRKHANSLVALVDLEAIFLAAATNHRLLRLRCLLSFQLPPESVTRSFQMHRQMARAGMPV